jgi:hypothetical protein
MPSRWEIILDVLYAGDDMRYKFRAFAIVVITALFYCGQASSQKSVAVTKNYVAWAVDFLQAVYPNLGGKRYTFSLVAYGEYDKREDSAKTFQLYVGEGPKYEYTRVVGGYSGLTPPPADFHPGPQYPAQVLSTSFKFDYHERLSSFAAYGPSISKPEAIKYLGEFLSSHPGVTDAQIIVELEREGARYKPSDKEEFIRNLPMAKLEGFLGKLQVVSVKFLNGRSDLGLTVLGDWKVIVHTQESGASVIKYELTFDEFNGDLTSIIALPN